MKILNQTKSMSILKYLFFTIFISSNFILKAINPPTNITAAVSCGKLITTWTAPTGVASYELKVYKGVWLSGNPFTNISGTITLPSTATGYTYPGNASEVAEPGDYYFEIVARPGSGPPSTPAYTPVNMNVSYNALAPSITNITCNGFTANWTSLVNSCTSITYRYSIDQYSGATYIGTLVNNATSTNTSVVITNALPNSYYKLRVEAKANNGTSTTYIGTTETSAYQTSAIANVTGLSLSNSGGTPTNNDCSSFTAVWDRNLCANTYELQLYLSNTPTPTLISTTTVTGNTNSNQSYTFSSGLTPGYAYKVSIKAIYIQSGVEIATSGTVTSSFLTLPAKIAPPTNLRLISKCGRTVTIGWNAVSDARATGYLCDLSSGGFTPGSFAFHTGSNQTIQDFNIIGATSNTVTFILPTFSPFTSRTFSFRIKTKNSNNECNSDYTNLYSINLKENAASINPTAYAYFSQIEAPNTFKTNYWAFSRPHSVSFSADACVTACQIKVDMANADGTIYTPTHNGITSFLGVYTTGANVASLLSSTISINDYIIQHGGILSNYDGIGTATNINDKSFLLSPETKYGTQVLSTGYHRITLLYWIGAIQYTQTEIVKVINSLADFKLQYPPAPFIDFYFNTANTQYNYGPGFQCLPFSSSINAMSSYPNVVVDPPYSGLTWDDIYEPYTKIIFSQAATADKFYDNAGINNVIGTKILTPTETQSLRNGTLDLITVFSSLNIAGNINYIGIYSGASYGSNPLPFTTKIISFGYTAKPTNVTLTNKCANDVSLTWTGSGSSAGTIYYVTMGTSYNPVSNTISNYSTSGSSGSLVTYNNYAITTNQLQTVLNIGNSSTQTIYFQVKSYNPNGSGCTSNPSNVFSFTVYKTPIRLNYSLTSYPFAFPIQPTINYDVCIEKCSLEVQNLNVPNDNWIGPLENLNVFEAHYNTINTNYVPFLEVYTSASIQNYINAFRTNLGSNPFFSGYDGDNFVSVGNLFRSFKGTGTYRIRLVYKLTNGVYGNSDQTITINSADFPVTLKNANGTFRPSNVFEVPFQKGYLSKTINTYTNTKYLSAYINPYSLYSTSSIYAVAIDFANTVSGFPSAAVTFNTGFPFVAPVLNATNLNSFLTTGIDLNAYAASLGALGSNYIRISYTTNSPSHGTVSAIYGFKANTTVASYIQANVAYRTESTQGFRNIILESDTTKVFTYDHNNHFYISGTDILIPDNNSTIVSSNNFFGFSGGAPSATDFQWDDQLLNLSLQGQHYSFDWDEIELFVSPMSSQPMNICDAIDQNSIGNICDNNTMVSVEDVVYKNNTYGNYVGSGNYTIDNLIMDQGLVDFGPDNEFIIQQSAAPNSYCVSTYGLGWRLPTATEIGKEDDLPVATFTTNPAYFENSTGNIWTSNLWQSNLSWWEAKGSQTDNQISLNNSYYTTNNYVRCVYKAQ